jgi:hypothetical protein
MHPGLSQRPGYDAKDHMTRVQYYARASEPNWEATLCRLAQHLFLSWRLHRRVSVREGGVQR